MIRSSRHHRVLCLLGLATFAVYTLLLVLRLSGSKTAVLQDDDDDPDEGLDVYDLLGQETIPLPAPLHLDNSTHPELNRATRSGEGGKTVFDIIQKGLLQGDRMKSFCSGYTFLSPDDTEMEPPYLGNLLYDDAHKVVYCALPQTGGSKISTMFKLLQKGYTPEQILTGTPKATPWKAHSLEDLPPSKRAHRLKNYYKFMIIRNPFERLLGTYLEKVKYSRIDSLHYLNLKKEIIAWSSCQNHSDTLPKMPKFAEFINYYLSHYKMMDQHFQTALDACTPCLIKYDFYASYEVLNYQMEGLLSLLDIDKSYYFNDIHYAHHDDILRSSFITNKLVSAYYSKLGCDKKRRLLKMMEEEIEFFYSVHPEAIGIHLKYFPNNIK